MHICTREQHTTLVESTRPVSRRRRSKNKNPGGRWGSPEQSRAGEERQSRRQGREQNAPRPRPTACTHACSLACKDGSKEKRPQGQRPRTPPHPQGAKGDRHTGRPALHAVTHRLPRTASFFAVCTALDVAPYGCVALWQCPHGPWPWPRLSLPRAENLSVSALANCKACMPMPPTVTVSHLFVLCFL
jgi:hypothetical protein